MLRRWPAECWPEGSVPRGKNFSEALAEGFPPEETARDEACRGILTAGWGALVRDNRAVQVGEVLRPWEDFLREGTEGSAPSLAQRAASVEVARMSFGRVAEEEGDSWKAPGRYLIAVSVGALFSGEHRSPLLTQ